MTLSRYLAYGWVVMVAAGWLWQFKSLATVVRMKLGL